MHLSYSFFTFMLVALFIYDIAVFSDTYPFSYYTDAMEESTIDFNEK